MEHQQMRVSTEKETMWGEERVEKSEERSRWRERRRSGGGVRKKLDLGGEVEVESNLFSAEFTRFW